jgi:hypothetical protein
MEKIKNKKLEEIYNAAQGKRSHFIFFNDEPEEFVKELVKQNWIKEIVYKSDSGSRMYAITIDLVNKFRELSDVEQSQIAYNKKSALEKAEMDLKEFEEHEEKIKKQMAEAKTL